MAQTIGLLDLNAFSDLYNDANQYFWFEGNASATYGAGVHVTLSPDTSFIANPSGQNILMNTDGISIRNGLLPMMTLDNDSLDFNVINTTAGTYTNVASFSGNGAELFIDNSSVALFSDTVRIGKNEDGNAKLLASPNGLDVITNDQAIAFSVTTSDKIDTVKTYICPSVEPILPNEATIITLINGYDSVATGTPITYRIWRTIYYAYNQVDSMSGRTAKSKAYYDFVFTKGTSSSATKTFSFVKQNGTDETDTQNLSVSISYNSSNGTITITAPNYYYYPDIIPTTPNTSVYYNVLSTEVGYAETQKYIASMTMQGNTSIYGAIHIDIPEYIITSSNKQVFGADVTNATTSSNVMTMTATAKGDSDDVFSLSSSPLPRVYVYTGRYWTNSSITGLYLNINETGAIPVYSNGQIVSGTNDPWKTVCYIGIYYDGSKYVVFHNKPTGKDVDGELAYAIASAGLYDDVIV